MTFNSILLLLMLLLLLPLPLLLSLLAAVVRLLLYVGACVWSCALWYAGLCSVAVYWCFFMKLTVEILIHSTL